MQTAALLADWKQKKLGKAELTHMPAKLDALDNRCDEKVNCK